MYNCINSLTINQQYNDTNYFEIAFHFYIHMAIVKCTSLLCLMTTEMIIYTHKYFVFPFFSMQF